MEKFLWIILETSKVLYIFVGSIKLLIRFKIKITVNLILLGDRSLSKVFLNCFWILFHDSTSLTVIEYFLYLLVLLKTFMKLSCVELEVSEEVLKTDGDKLIWGFAEEKKYFLSKFHLGILTRSFVWRGDWYGNNLVKN